MLAAEALWLRGRGRKDSAPAMPDPASRVKRLRFRAWHRGTREADYMIGGFFERYHESWGDTELDWFEHLLEEDDVDVMGWALGTIAVPERFDGAQMAAMRRLDYVDVPR